VTCDSLIIQRVFAQQKNVAARGISRLIFSPAVQLVVHLREIDVNNRDSTISRNFCLPLSCYRIDAEKGPMEGIKGT
jgi:ribosomal protein L1